MYKDKDLCLLLEILEINMVKKYLIKAYVGKSMKKKYGKKILDNSLSAGKDFAKIAGKKVLTKSAEATGDLIGKKIPDRITKSARNKEQKEDDRIMEETQEIIIPPEKREQIIRDLKVF